LRVLIFNDEMRPMTYNTFTCHRLLHWALEEHGYIAQYRLKRELLETFFCRNENIEDPYKLCAAVERADLDPLQALRKQEILANTREEVRAARIAV
jgi:predicted DsbA family dithiol-disulfide isomerase